MWPSINRKHLYVQIIPHPYIEQMLELTSKLRGDSKESSLVDDGVISGRGASGQQLLAKHPGCYAPLDLCFVIDAITTDDRANVVFGLQQPWDGSRLVRADL